MGLPTTAVYVENFMPAAAGTTIVLLDIVLPATSSSAIPAAFAQFAALFTPCKGAGVSPVGCPAGAGSTLVTALKQFGLPIFDAFYNQA